MVFIEEAFWPSRRYPKRITRLADPFSGGMGRIFRRRQQRKKGVRFVLRISVSFSATESGDPKKKGVGWILSSPPIFFAREINASRHADSPGAIFLGLVSASYFLGRPVYSLPAFFLNGNASRIPLGPTRAQGYRPGNHAGGLISRSPSEQK